MPAETKEMLQSAANTIQSVASNNPTTSSGAQSSTAPAQVKKSQSQNQPQLQGLGSIGGSHPPSAATSPKKKEFGSAHFGPVPPKTSGVAGKQQPQPPRLSHPDDDDDSALYENKSGGSGGGGGGKRSGPSSVSSPTAVTASPMTTTTATTTSVSSPHSKTQPKPPTSAQPLVKKASFRSASPPDTEATLTPAPRDAPPIQKPPAPPPQPPAPNPTNPPPQPPHSHPPSHPPQPPQTSQSQQEQQLDPQQYQALFETNQALKSELQRLSVFELKCKSLEKEVKINTLKKN